jgi:hypothetical protein
MATYTLKVESVCTGGEHIGIGLYKDAVKVGVKQITKTEAITDDTDLTEVIICLIKKAIKRNNANTAAKRKAAIEGLQVIL